MTPVEQQIAADAAVELRKAIDAFAHDLQRAVRHHAERGMTQRLLTHGAVELAGSLMIGAIHEDADARAECQRLAQSLELLIAPTSQRPS